MTTAYDQSFFKGISVGSSSSAERVVPYLVSLLKPRSVVDVGCGIGTWAAEFIRQGVAAVLGVDGVYVDKSQLRIPANVFVDWDLELPLALEQTFDLAVSLEVAEHLSPGRASSFVRDLTALAPVVVFSAAIPFQGGINHINEQWSTYWNSLFAAQGFQAVDCLRARFWNDICVESWYRQNMVMYAAKDRVRQFERGGGVMPLDVVHPELFLAKVAHPPLGYLLRSLPSSVKRSFRSRILRIKASKCQKQSQR
jgi:SAM-dependent methyltransferase